MKPSVPLVLLAGLVLMAVAVGVVLSRSPLVVLRTNAVPEAAELAVVPPGTQICQGGETLPRGTSAIRLAINMGVGTQTSVEVLSGGRLLAGGSQGSGWRGASVTVPLGGAVPVTSSGVSICAKFGPSSEPIVLIGAHSSTATAVSSHGRPLSGRIEIEYLRPASSSWWSRMGLVARHMGLGRAWSGRWVYFFVLALSATLVALVARIALRGLR